ncbi:MAG: SPOR domain-containing protein [Romboutsia sp.]
MKCLVVLDAGHTEKLQVKQVTDKSLGKSDFNNQTHIYYRVVVGNYLYRKNAETIVERLNNLNIDSFIVVFSKDRKKYNKVIAGIYKYKKSAQNKVNNLKDLGFDAFLDEYKD